MSNNQEIKSNPTKKVGIALLVLIIAGLLIYSFWPETVVPPMPTAKDTETPAVIPEVGNYFKINADNFDFSFRAGEPVTFENLKGNTAKIWIRTYSENEKGDIDYGTYMKAFVLHPVRDPAKYWNTDLPTTNEVTLDVGMYLIKDMFSGVTVLVDVKEDGTYLVTDDEARNIRIRYKPDELTKEEINKILDGNATEGTSN